MPSADFQRVEALFFEARALPPSERDAFLERACAGDDALRADVAGLLRHDSGDPADGVPSAGSAGAFIPAVARDPLAPPKDRIGPYECGAVLGRGGMGVVYKARDTRLGRAVAIKTLPPEYHDHPERLARFTREAQLLASLSHPGIATVYGLEDDGTTIYLVMEFIEGDTLADRLVRGALPIEEALSVCLKIAEAVEAAHTADVIHRDLKPGNVMLTREGGVKVLDFGLARELPPGGGPGRGGASGGPRTREGIAVGTPGYMSPEQARGQDVDRRTDVFALGCILFECLTGQAAFAATTHADAVAHVLDREPDYDALPRRTPPAVRRLLRRCLAKQMSQRMRDAGDIALELESALVDREWSSASVPAASAGSGVARQAPPTWPARAARVLVPVAAVAVIAAATVALLRPAPVRTAAVQPVRRFSLNFPGRAAQAELAHVRVALSRDGAKMALAAADGSGQHHLWVRDAGQYDFTPLEGTRDAWLPRFSPDGDWLVYFDGAALLKRRLAGGSPVKLADLNGAWGEFAWSADGYVTYVRDRGRGVTRVRDRGGDTPTVVTKPAAGAGEFAHLNPCVLPDGSAVLYTTWDRRGGLRIEARHLAGGTTSRVVENASSPKVAETAHGTYLLYARAGTVFAAPFDFVSLKRTGPETAVADGVMTDRALASACYDVADDGTLAYVPGPAFVEESRLAWYDPVGRGNTFPFNDEREPFAEPHFSRDGMKLSVVLKGDASRPFLFDLERRTFAPVMIEGSCASAALSPDGTRLAYSANPGGRYAVYVRDLATEADDKLTGEMSEVPSQVRWSPDGKTLAFAMAPDAESRRDVWVVDVTTKRMAAFCTGEDEERAPRFSPDGRWLAYASDATGTRQVYLRRFPDGAAPKQVSDAGGDWPEWSLDGLRVFYRTKGGLYAVGVSPEEGATTGRPTLLYARRFGQSDPDLPDYTLAPDGRLLLVEPSERGPTVSGVNVVLNWPTLLPPAARRR